MLDEHVGRVRRRAAAWDGSSGELDESRLGIEIAESFRMEQWS